VRPKLSCLQPVIQATGSTSTASSLHPNSRYHRYSYSSIVPIVPIAEWRIGATAPSMVSAPPIVPWPWWRRNNFTAEPIRAHSQFARAEPILAHAGPICKARAETGQFDLRAIISLYPLHSFPARSRPKNHRVIPDIIPNRPKNCRVILDVTPKNYRVFF
jgi:hypothetical protein